MLEALEGPNSPDTLDAAVALALTLVEFELAKEAEPILARVYGAQARDYGEMHSYTLSTLSHLVPLRIFRGCVDEAMPSIEQAVRGWTRLHGPRDRRVLHIHTEHPLESAELFNGVDASLADGSKVPWASMVGEARRAFEWCVANRQNGVEWALLHERIAARLT